MSEITIAQIEEAIGIKKCDWAKRCHEVSIEIVRSGIFPLSRVARGFCRGVPAQHSWVVVGDDCYDEDAQLLDATLWSYDPSVKDIWQGTLRCGKHHPHGWLDGIAILDYGRPPNATDKAVELTPKQPLSFFTSSFVELLGPLDRDGWQLLANSFPVRGWPAGEILAAMHDTESLSGLVPIDKLGMLTDRNPGDLYLA